MRIFTVREETPERPRASSPGSGYAAVAVIGRLLAVRGSTATIGLALLALAAPARGEPPAVVDAADPAVVQGIERPAVEPGDSGRDAAATLLFLPRKGVDLLFKASGAVAAVMRDQQIVPRVAELVDPPPGDVSVFPSLTLGAGQPPLVGAQMIASGGETTTRFSVGFGGVHDLLGEGRIHLTYPGQVPLVFRLEGLADARTGLPYLGLGQVPAEDPRNHFQGDAASHEADYWQRRSRLIGSLGVRPGDDVEVNFAMTLVQSDVTDAPDDPETIDRVFVRGTVPGAPGIRRTLYGEAALRLDTRPTSARPSGGVLMETYAGEGCGLAGDPSRFLRLGGRAALFLPILRPTNILSAALVVDGLATPSDAPVPFTELVGQPDYRGSDTRRDYLSYVVSVDYRWEFLAFLGARVFVDVAAVGPDARHILEEPARVAVGFGLDVYTPSTTLGELSFAGSADGVNASLTFGVPSRFGDRLHRY
jgi:hypothetical protein